MHLCVCVWGGGGALIFLTYRTPVTFIALITIVTGADSIMVAEVVRRAKRVYKYTLQGSAKTQKEIDVSFWQFKWLQFFLKKKKMTVQGIIFWFRIAVCERIRGTVKQLWNAELKSVNPKKLNAKRCNWCIANRDRSLQAAIMIRHGYTPLQRPRPHLSSRNLRVDNRLSTPHHPNSEQQRDNNCFANLEKKY